jgi:hypothetical protein
MELAASRRPAQAIYYTASRGSLFGNLGRKRMESSLWKERIITTPGGGVDPWPSKISLPSSYGLLTFGHSARLDSAPTSPRPTTEGEVSSPGLGSRFLQPSVAILNCQCVGEKATAGHPLAALCPHPHGVRNFGFTGVTTRHQFLSSPHSLALCESLIAIGWAGGRLVGFSRRTDMSPIGPF